MDPDAPREYGREHGESKADLRLRVGGALAASAAGGLVTERAVGTVVGGNEVVSLVVSVGVAWAIGAVLMRKVITPLLRSRDELRDRYRAALADSLQDPLTGLGNHRAFQEELDRQVEAAIRYGVPLALAIIDLDDFKAINDGGGHAAGDRALAAFGRLLAAAVRRVDRCFRIGGDEFAILMPHTEVEGARVVARRMLATSLSPAQRSEGLAPISFSAGISALPDPAASRAQLYSQADAALYAAKHAGRTDVVVFDPAQASVVASPDSAGAAVAEVIGRGLLSPAYQPIVAIANGEVLGFEGLIRPTQAAFPDPGSLLAAAEASGHLAALEMSCIEILVAGARSLHADRFLSVNISPQTILSPEFSAPALLSILVRHAFPPRQLVLELTERQPIDNIERVRAKLDACRTSGIRLAADDLGAGNAGLRLLSELRFDILKVDLSLVQRSAPGAPSSDVVGSVVELASRTRALVVGEGIEHPEQLRQIAALGVVAGQGFLLGRPGPLPGADALPLDAPPVQARPTPAAPVTDAAGGARLAQPIEAAPTLSAAPVASGPPAAQAMASWRQSIGLPTS